MGTRRDNPATSKAAAWIALLGTGLILRLIGINSRGLWTDEAWSVWAARLSAAIDVLHVAWARPPSAPLYRLGLQSASVREGDAVVCNYPMLLWTIAQYYDGPTRGLPSDWDVRWGYPLVPPSQRGWVTALRTASSNVERGVRRL